MKRSQTLSVFLFLVNWCCLSATQSWADQSLKDSERLYLMAHDLLCPIELQALYPSESPIDPATNAQRIRQACLYLEAAVQLDQNNIAAWRDLYQMYLSDAIDDPGRARDAARNYSQLVPSDPTALENWITYRLNQLQDRPSREAFLNEMMNAAQNHPLLGSELLVRQGIYALEKGMIDGPDGARTLFENAVYRWMYNDDAIARALQLPPPAVSDTTTPDQRIQQNDLFERNHRFFTVLFWRVRLYKNPYDLEALIQLTETLEHDGYHRLTSGYYKTAYDLIEALPQFGENHLYKVRLIECLGEYASGNYPQCLAVTSKLLKDHPKDLYVHCIRYKTLSHIGQTDQAQTVLQQAMTLTAEKMVTPLEQLGSDELAELSWFFCFIQPDPGRALDLSQKASQKSPDDLRIRHLLDYAYILNGMMDQAKTLADTSDISNPVGALVQAHVQLAANEVDAAIRTIKAVDRFEQGILSDTFDDLSTQITAKEASKASDTASTTTAGNNTPVIIKEPALSPDSSDAQAVQPDRIEHVLTNFFKNQELQLPLAPEKYLQCRLRLDKDMFHFNDPIEAYMDINNVGESDLSVGPGSFLNPTIIMTASVTPVSSTSVDAGASETAASETFVLMHMNLLDRPLLQAGRSIVRQVPLNVGRLRQILQQHIGTHYKITFQAYLDPLQTGKNSFVGKIPSIQPLPVTVIRKAIIPSSTNMSFYIDSLRAGQVASRLTSLETLSCLLRAMNSPQDSMIRRFTNKVDVKTIWRLIGDNLTNRDDSVRAWSAYAAWDAPLPKDPELFRSFQNTLSDTNWFVRFLALDALNSIADMDDYLRWALSVEQDPLLVRQIQFLLHENWTTIEITQTAPKPAENIETEKAPTLEPVL